MRVSQVENHCCAPAQKILEPPLQFFLHVVQNWSEVFPRSSCDSVRQTPCSKISGSEASDSVTEACVCVCVCVLFRVCPGNETDPVSETSCFPEDGTRWTSCGNPVIHWNISMALVRKKTIPTERPSLVGEVSATFCGWRVSHGQRNGSPLSYSRFSRWEIRLNMYLITKQLNSVAWIREGTLPTERPPLLSEVSGNFCG
jgi:hypothetical protein